MKPKRKRLKRQNMTTEEWVKHRKLRKKVASARWYVKKRIKESEVDSQKRSRCHKLETIYWENLYHHTLYFAERRAALDHLLRGWPARPYHVPADVWCALMDLTETCMGRLVVRYPDPVFWTPNVIVHMRKLCMGEWMKQLQNQRAEVEAGDNQSSISWEIRPRQRVSENPSITGVSFAPSSSASEPQNKPYPWYSPRSSWLSWSSWACTGLGLVFCQLAVADRKHWWSRILAWFQKNQPNPNHTTNVHTHGPIPPQHNPPAQNPTQNIALDMDVQNSQKIQQLLYRLVNLTNCETVLDHNDDRDFEWDVRDDACSEIESEEEE